jgi:hypothetical protein
MMDTQKKNSLALYPMNASKYVLKYVTKVDTSEMTNLLSSVSISNKEDNTKK